MREQESGKGSEFFAAFSKTLDYGNSAPWHFRFLPKLLTVTGSRGNIIHFEEILRARKYGIVFDSKRFRHRES